MKKTRLFLSVLFLSCTVITPAQTENKIQFVNTLTVFPGHPLSTDTVWVIASGQISGYLYCNSIGRTITIGQGTITVVSNFSTNISVGTTNCLTKDSLSIGVLNPGTYSLNYVMKDAGNSMIYGSKTITITVSDNLGLTTEDLAFQSLNVYPNPSSNGKYRIGIKTGGVDLDLKVINCFGSEVLLKKSIQPKEELDLSEQADGVYFLLLKNNNWSKVIRLVKLDSE